MQRGAYEIFRCYLKDRHRCASIDGFVCDLEQVVFGVPQSSVLGRTLFLIYLNCKLVLPNYKIITSDDDTALLVHGKI